LQDSPEILCILLNLKIHWYEYTENSPYQHTGNIVRLSRLYIQSQNKNLPLVIIIRVWQIVYHHLTFTGLCILIYSYNESQRDTFSHIYLLYIHQQYFIYRKHSCMFRCICFIFKKSYSCTLLKQQNYWDYNSIKLVD